MDLDYVDHLSFLEDYGVRNCLRVYHNLSSEELVEASLKRDQGVLAESGALCIRTGKFTGRSPKLSPT